jgi:hypothetical protein
MLTMTLATLLLATLAAQPDPPQEWALSFRGTIGSLKVEMELDRSSLGISGSYRYQRSRERLLLESRGDVGADGGLELIERSADRLETGRFDGHLGPDGHFTGTWKDAKGQRSLPFTLTSVSEAPSAASAWTREWTSGWATIVVRALGGSQIRARGFKTVEVGREGGEPYANIGDFHAVGEIRNGAAIVKDGECRITLRLEAGSLHAEDNGECGGAGVSFTDDYS